MTLTGNSDSHHPRTSNLNMTSARQPEAAMPPIACTLSEGGQLDRVQLWRTLVSRALSHVSVDGAILVRFPADPPLIGELAELAVREQQCCEFFSFTVTVAGNDEVALEVKAPSEALEEVASLFQTT